MKKFIRKIQSVKLMWKLMIPFLLVTFIGNATTAYVGLTSQHKMIKREERKEIIRLCQLFMGKIDDKKKQALSLAKTFAENPQVQLLMANRNRAALKELLLPIYHTLKEEFEIAQFHFHIPEGSSFLRLHMLDKYGESIVYRKTITKVMKTKKAVAGLERGLAGLGIRGIAPVFHENKLVGTIEIGYPFGDFFLRNLKQTWGADYTVYDKTGDNAYQCLSTTLALCDSLRFLHYLDESKKGPTVLVAPPGYPDKSFILSRIKDYSGNVVALVKLEKDRSEIVARLKKTQNIMVCIGLAGIFFSCVIIWIVSVNIVKPISKIVNVAQEIAAGKRERRIRPRYDDELGVLARSLNSMLDSLKGRRRQIEAHARTLEKRVAERTADLVSSERKYRTLIEHLPLIVYRLLNDGTVELINPYFTEKLGYSVEEVVRDKTFWRRNIYGKDEHAGRDFLSNFGENGKEYRAERVVRDKHGNLLTLIDRMIPMKDDQGQVKWIDGIMLDITQLKKLQKRDLQTEEIRVLGEISARFAHEIRNPLTIAGGFARRLQKALPENDKNRKLARIMVQEVARLEQIIRIMLASIEPFTLCIAEYDINHILRTLLDEMEYMTLQKGIRIKTSLSPTLPKVQCDINLLSRAFESLIKHAALSMPEEELFVVSTFSENNHISVIFTYTEEGLSKEDLDQFFFPRFTKSGMTSDEGLPLANVIIHRHGGNINISGEEGNLIIIEVRLPIKQ